MEKKYYVYYHVSQKTGEIYYVGKGSGKRFAQFKLRGKLWDAFYKKHGCKAVIAFKDLSEKMAFTLEIKEIKRLKEINQCRANISNGGDGVTVDKRWWGDNIKKSQIKRFKENPMPKGKDNKTFKHFCDNNILIDEYKTLSTTQISNKYNVSVTTVWSRLKSLGVKLEKPGKKSIQITCKNDGKIYKSINEAARHYGVFRENIRKVLKNQYKHTNNLVFEYIK
jgi:hypothetical protein